MKYRYNEETDYGQDVLELAGIVALLMDEEKEYRKVDINAILIEVKTKAYEIQKNMAGRNKDEYLGA